MNIFAFTKRKNVAKIAVFAVFFFMLLVAQTPTASAAESTFGTQPTFIGECTSDGVLGLYCAFTEVSHWLILGLLYALGNLFSLLLSAMSFVAIWVIRSMGIKIVTHGAVSLGFGISLDIANVIFVVAIILIAFATILRWHEYEAKKMLPKLIITALLVNFSLLAAGLMIDTSNVFTTYFMGEDKVSAERIGAALSPQSFNIPQFYGGGITDPKKLLANLRSKYKDGPEKPLDLGPLGPISLPENVRKISKEEIQGRLGLGAKGKQGFEDIFFSDDPANVDFIISRMVSNASRLPTGIGGQVSPRRLWAKFFDMLPRIIFAVLATFVAMMTVIAIVIMALIRNIWVVILLITMPLAWSLRVLPKFEQYWTKWWEKFLNWGLLYLPTVSFFLYLAVRTAESTREKMGTVVPASQFGAILEANTKTAGFFAESVGGGPTVIESFVVMLIVIGLMIAGLKIAQAMGSAVAGVFADLAGKGSRKLAGGLVKGSAAIPAGLAGAALGVPVGLAVGSWKGWKSSAFGGTIFGGLGGIFKGAAKGAGAGLIAPDATPKLLAEGAASVLSVGSLLPGVGAVTGPLAAKLSSFANSQKEIEEIQSRWEGLQGFALESALKNTLRGFATAAEKAAALDYMAKNHKLDWLDSKKDKGAILAAVAMISSMSPGIENKKNSTLKAIASHFADLAPKITGETPDQARQRTSAAEMRSHDAKHVAEHLDNFTAAQIQANAAASAKNENIHKVALAKLISSSPALAADAALRANVAALETVAKRLDDMKNDVSDSGVRTRMRLDEQKRQLLVDIGGRIDNMTAAEKALMTGIDQDRVTKWERLKRVVGSAEPEDKHGAHKDHTSTPMGSVAGAIGDEFSIGPTRSGGHGGGGGGTKSH